MSKQKVVRKDQRSVEKPKDLKIPLSADLEVRDLVNPITVRRIQILRGLGIGILLVSVLGLIGYKYFKSPAGETILTEWMEAAGGQSTWHDIKHGSFVRTHNVYSESGEVLSSKIQKIFFEKEDWKVKLLMNSKAENGDDLWIGKDEEGYWAIDNEKAADPKKTSDDQGMMCDSKWCTPDCAMKMSFYRFGMPFNLVSDGVILENGGMQNVGDREAQVLNVSYKPEAGNDRWVFYAHPDDNLIRKIEYHHKSDDGHDFPEEMFWSDYKEVRGISIAHKWSRFWTNGQVLEEYLFSDIDFSSPLPEAFDKRPDQYDWASVSVEAPGE